MSTRFYGDVNLERWKVELASPHTQMTWLISCLFVMKTKTEHQEMPKTKTIFNRITSSSWAHMHIIGMMKQRWMCRIFQKDFLKHVWCIILVFSDSITVLLKIIQPSVWSLCQKFKVIYFDQENLILIIKNISEKQTFEFFCTINKTISVWNFYRVCSLL